MGVSGEAWGPRLRNAKCALAGVAVTVGLLLSAATVSHGIIVRGQGQQPRSEPGKPPAVAPANAKPLLAQQSTTVIAADKLGAVGDTITLKATLKHKFNGTAVTGQAVKFFVDGTYAGTGQTDAAGNAQTPYKVPNVVAGRTIKADYAGSPGYQPSSDTAGLTVIKAGTKIEAAVQNPDSPKLAGSSAFIQGELFRITDNSGLDGRAVRISANGTAVGNVATSPSGRFSFTYTIPADLAGTVEMAASFAGDSLYFPVSANFSFTVSPPAKPGYLFWNDALGKVGQTVAVSATLKKTPLISGAGFSGETINFQIYSDGEWHTVGSATTNGEGQAGAQIKIERDAGNYSFRARVKRNPANPLDVTEVSSNKHFLVLKSSVQLSVAGPSQAKVGDSVMFTVRAMRTTDQEYVRNVSVSFAGSATKKTNQLGTVIFFYDIPSVGSLGLRTLTVESYENERYSASSAIKTITVGPKTN